jgi:hypothetical protein
MPDVFWIGLGVVVFGFLVGVIAAARSRSTPTKWGAIIGFGLGFLAAFPLLAIGISNG